MRSVAQSVNSERPMRRVSCTIDDRRDDERFGRSDDKPENQLERYERDGLAK
jgi:hypothetical protein